MLKFGQKVLTTKDFYRQRQITNIFTIDVNKVVVPDKLLCNNGKDCHCIVGYQVDGETIIPWFIKTPKNIFSYGVSQYNKNSAYTMLFNVSEKKSGRLSMKRFGMRLSHIYLKNWQQNR